MMTDEQNRRQAVRVIDRILFSFEPVPADKYETIAFDFSQGMSPYKQEGMADIEVYVGAQYSLGKLRDFNEDLANFLQHLDAKINQLLKEVKKEKTLFDNLVLQEVSFSSTGISFDADTAFATKTPLAFNMVLLPSYVYIYCLGKVVKCEAVKDSAEGEKRFRISAQFTVIMEEDREKMIQHNFKQQSMILRQKRQQG